MGDNFNENLKVARERKGMTQKEVADSIGVAKSTYSLYESGGREPNVQTIKKLANVLNASSDDLLGLTSDPHPLTIAAHFEGDSFTEAEMDEIQSYIDYVRHKREKK